MKKWPKELNDVQPDGEEIGEDGTIKFSWDCRLTLTQRKILRAFLFDLKKTERFVYFYSDMEKEFVVRVKGKIDIQVDYYWSESESKEKTYWLKMKVVAQKKTR